MRGVAWVVMAGKILDFIQEEGTFVDRLEAAKLLSYGSSERALGVAKQLASIRSSDMAAQRS